MQYLTLMHANIDKKTSLCSQISRLSLNGGTPVTSILHTSDSTKGVKVAIVSDEP